MHAHIEMLRALAQGRAGKFVLASYGEDPETGQKLRPKVRSYDGDTADAVTKFGNELAAEDHRNLYMQLVLMRPDLAVSRKGGEEDVDWVLGLVADFDDGDAGAYLERLPLAPDYVLETSAGRFQCFYFFEEPMAPAHAKPLAVALCEYAGCDHGTKDLSHVWRIAGTKNWPNAKKVNAGRDMEPQDVKVVEPWDETYTSPSELRRVLGCQARAAPRDSVTARAGAHVIKRSDLNNAAAPPQTAALDLDGLDDDLRERIEEPTPVGRRSEVFYSVVRSLAEMDFIEDEIGAICEANPVGAKYEGRIPQEVRRALGKVDEEPDASDLPGTTGGNGHADNRVKPDPPAPAAPTETNPTPDIRLTFAERWLGHEPGDQGFVVDDLVPTGMVTLLVADGGAGKSILCQTLLSCVAAPGMKFLGHNTQTGRAAGAFFEDPDNVLHIRQNRIHEVLGIDYADVGHKVHIASYFGLDARMWNANRNKPTPFLKTFQLQLSEIPDLKLCVLDNAAFIFSGNENDRVHVTSFLNALNNVARDLDIAVLLTTHTSKSSLDNDAVNAASGSTAWINCCRSVLKLVPEKREEPARLTCVKSNHAKRGEPITLQWIDAVLMAEESESDTIRYIKRQKAERVFLKLLAEAATQGRRISDSRNSTNFGPKLFAGMPNSEGVTKKDFGQAMEHLFADGKIRAENYGRASDQRKQLVVVSIA